MKFFTSNDTAWRLLRTISQGILGLLIANIDMIVGSLSFSTELKGLIVAFIVTILTPLYSEIGKYVDTVKDTDTVG